MKYAHGPHLSSAHSSTIANCFTNAFRQPPKFVKCKLFITWLGYGIAFVNHWEGNRAINKSKRSGENSNKPQFVKIERILLTDYNQILKSYCERYLFYNNFNLYLG